MARLKELIDIVVDVKDVLVYAASESLEKIVDSAMGRFDNIWDIDENFD